MTILLLSTILFGQTAAVAVNGGKILDITNPYVVTSNEYQGQIHCHTTNSDGADTPTELATFYKNAGYDFLAITDHDYLTPDPSVSGILHINGVEETATEGHIISINPTSQKTETAAQAIINAIIADDALPSMAHPNYSGADWTDAELSAFTNYSLIEVWNVVVGPNENAEDKWDTLLTRGRRSNATAVDDCHDITYGNKGWIQVFANALDVDNIVDAISDGNFYSSTGPNLSVSLSGTTITATTSGSSTINWIGTGGSDLQTTTTATTDDYAIVGDEQYIRIKITRDADTKYAWSNPIYVDSVFNTSVVSGRCTKE